MSEIARMLLVVIDWTLTYVTGENARSILIRLFHLLLIAFVPFLIWWAIVERFKTPSKSLDIYRKLVILFGKYTFQMFATLFRFLFMHDKQKGKKEKFERTEKRHEDDFYSYANDGDEE